MGVKDFFSFSKSEKRGILVFVFIIVLLLVSTRFLDYFNVLERTDFTEFEDEINKFEKELKQKNIEDSLSKINQNIIVVKELFEFDPNTINDTDWVKLGFANWQIRTINNYKAKGGKFRVKSDVGKIYGISDTLFQQLYPFILLPDSNNYQKKEYKKFNKYEDNETQSKYKKESLIIDINTCDTSDLQKLKGIGSAFSKRIVKYRESLGGFIDVYQLKEVYGLNEELFNQIHKNVSIYNTTINQININTVDEEQLKKHPYIGWKLSKVIIAYRKTHGNFKDVSEIKKIHLITDEIYSKIAPYLKTS